jgi:hypothetical protein
MINDAVHTVYDTLVWLASSKIGDNNIIDNLLHLAARELAG